MATAPGIRKSRLFTSGLNQYRGSGAIGGFVSGRFTSPAFDAASCSSQFCHTPCAYPWTSPAVFGSEPSTITWTGATSPRPSRSPKSARRTITPLSRPDTSSASTSERWRASRTAKYRELRNDASKLFASGVGDSPS